MTVCRPVIIDGHISIGIACHEIKSTCVLTDFFCSLPVVFNHGQPWSLTMVNHGPGPWSTMVGHGVNYTMVNRGRPFNKTWSTMVNHRLTMVV